MRHLVKRIICVCTAIPLVACSAKKPAASEWKSVYLQLVMDGIIGTRDLSGIAVNYGIELYDMDFDGVPELQERVSAHYNDYCMWFVADGGARQITGRISFRPEWDDMTEFVNLFRHNETSEVVAVHAAGSAFFTDRYCFSPMNDSGIWGLDSIWGTSPYRIDMPQIKYTRTDADGVEHEITEQEYQVWMDSISNECTRLAGEFLPLSDYFEFSEDTTEAFNEKLEKASATISDYFDRYDGIPNMVYEEYELPNVTK